MKSWIFQANPERFDLESFFATRPSVLTWTVSRQADQMRIGDRVYIWRAAAGEKDKAGVIAEAVVCSSVALIASDTIGAGFWLDESEAQLESERVWLKIIRVASPREQIRREWLKDDPVLSDMLIMKQPAGTNFLMTDSEAARMAQMWACVGQDWNRSESIAGLWAYVKTLGIPVSKLPKSPVAVVSLVTGRAVGGVYNKVMNFRSIDPRDPRLGMSGGGEIDKAVWAEFFDAETMELRTVAVHAEYERLWGSSDALIDVVPDAAALEMAVDREAGTLAQQTYENLILKYATQKMHLALADRPGSRPARRTVFERDPLVIAIAKVRAGFQCEVVGCAHPSFNGRDRKPYCEVHHIQPLADGGVDTIDNVVCLCPSHHREAHFGESREALKSSFFALRALVYN
ncbi:HNH endonuclease [Caballeronia sp. KNU42]